MMALVCAEFLSFPPPSFPSSSFLPSIHSCFRTYLLSRRLAFVLCVPTDTAADLLLFLLLLLLLLSPSFSSRVTAPQILTRAPPPPPQPPQPPPPPPNSTVAARGGRGDGVGGRRRERGRGSLIPKGGRKKRKAFFPSWTLSFRHSVIHSRFFPCRREEKREDGCRRSRKERRCNQLWDILLVVSLTMKTFKPLTVQ